MSAADAEVFRACEAFSHLNEYAAVDWEPGGLMTSVPDHEITEIGGALLDRGAPLSSYRGEPFRWYSPRDLNAILNEEIRTIEGRNIKELSAYLKSKDALDDIYNQFSLSRSDSIIFIGGDNYSGSIGCEGGCVRRISDCYRCLAKFINKGWYQVIFNLRASGQIITYHPIPNSGYFEFKHHRFYEGRRDPKESRFVLLRDLAASVRIKHVPKRAAGQFWRSNRQAVFMIAARSNAPV